MVKKACVLGALLIMIALTSGCETVSGAAKGAGEGAKKDWEKAKQTDAWMRKNLW